MRKPKPEEIELSHEESEALIARVKANELTDQDRELVAKLLGVFVWLTFTLHETRVSIGRLKTMLFGKGRSNRTKKPPNDDEGGSGPAPPQASPGDEPQAPMTGEVVPREQPPASDSTSASQGSGPRRGHGRYGAEAYRGAQTMSCRHEALAKGQRCPQCGRGTLYGLDDSVVVRIDGNALLSAIRYERERLRCSACLAVFTAPLPDGVGPDKYSARARVVLALSRCFLGVPYYRLQHLQAMLGVPVADATQWDQVERVADAVWPVFEQLKVQAAHSTLLYHDDTSARILSMIRENRSDEPPERVGMYTTGLVACQGERTIVLYFTGREHAGENLAAVLALRDPHLPAPLVMSDALAANQPADLPAHIRCLCLAHGLRQFTDIDAHFPQHCERVLEDLAEVFDHEHTTQAHSLDPEQRLAYHRQHSAPVLARLRKWIDEQFRLREVEPNSSLGKAFRYMTKHWTALTRFLHVPGAPLDSNTVERALKLMIRQRNNSRFFASAHSARISSMLSSVIATCAEAGVNPLDYLVALLDNRSAVFANPSQWLPWNWNTTVAT